MAKPFLNNEYTLKNEGRECKTGCIGEGLERVKEGEYG
jgi:hypothetical protein